MFLNLYGRAPLTYNTCQCLYIYIYIYEHMQVVYHVNMTPPPSSRMTPFRTDTVANRTGGICIKSRGDWAVLRLLAFDVLASTGLWRLRIRLHQFKHVATIFCLSQLMRKKEKRIGEHGPEQRTSIPLRV